MHRFRARLLVSVAIVGVMMLAVGHGPVAADAAPVEGKAGRKVSKPRGLTPAEGEVSVPEKWSATSRTFYDRTTGRHRAVISQVPINYQDAEGRWRPIDPTVRRATGPLAFAATENSFASLFAPATPGSTLTMEKQARTLSWTPVSLSLTTAAGPVETHLAGPARAEADGSRVSYEGVFPNATDTYALATVGVKQSLVLAAAPFTATTALPSDATVDHTATLTLAPDLQVRADGRVYTAGRFATTGSIELVDPAGSVVFALSRPVAFDAAPGSRAPGKLALGSYEAVVAPGTLTVTQRFPASWVLDDARVYPVTLDPVVSASSLADASIFTYEGEPDGNYDWSSELASGAYSGELTSLMRFELTAATMDARAYSISASYLVAYVTSVWGLPDYHLLHKHLDDAWSPSSATWNNMGSTDPNYSSSNYIGTPGYWVWYPHVDWVTEAASSSYTAWAGHDGKLSTRLRPYFCRSPNAWGCFDYILIDRFGFYSGVPPYLSVDYLIDADPPSTMVSVSGTLGGGGWYRSDATVTLSCSDTGDSSGCNKTYYKVDGGLYAEYTGPFTVTGSGSHAVSYYSTDHVQNVGDVATTTVKIDGLPPVTSSSLSGVLGNDGWYRSDVTTTLSCSDAHSGCNTTTYTINAGPLTAYTAPVTAVDEGSYTVSHYSSDVAGNVESAGSTSFKIDKTAPSSSASLSGTVGGGGWYRSAVTTTLSCGDMMSGCASTEYKIGGGAYAPYTGPVVIDGDGVHGVTFRSIDVAGNVETEQTVTFKIDKTPPTGTLSIPPLAAASFNVDWTATDAASGLAGTLEIQEQITFPPSGFSTVCTATVSGASQSGTCGRAPILPNIYCYRMVVSDVAGNMFTGPSTCTIFV